MVAAAAAQSQDPQATVNHQLIVNTIAALRRPLIIATVMVAGHIQKRLVEKLVDNVENLCVATEKSKFSPSMHHGKYPLFYAYPGRKNRVFRVMSPSNLRPEKMLFWRKS